MSFNVFIHLLLYPIDVGAVVAVIVWFSNFSAISCREQVHFQWDDDDDELDFYSVSLLKQQSADRHVIHSDTLFWFRAKQSLLLRP
jgi:hypothetical protein